MKELSNYAFYKACFCETQGKADIEGTYSSLCLTEYKRETLGWYLTQLALPFIFWIMNAIIQYRSVSIVTDQRFKIKSEHDAKEVDEVVASDGVMQHMMDEMNRTLKGKSGLEFEESFLRGMIVHHLGAIDMAQELLNQTERPELITLANEIISTQTAEVETMKGWLEEWFGGN